MTKASISDTTRSKSEIVKYKLTVDVLKAGLYWNKLAFSPSYGLIRHVQDLKGLFSHELCLHGLMPNDAARYATVMVPGIAFTSTGGDGVVGGGI